MPKWLVVGALVLFGAIGVLGLIKKKSSLGSDALEIPAVAVSVPVSPPQVEYTEVKRRAVVAPRAPFDDFPHIDRIFQLFTQGSSRLPIVETIQYTSAVSWLKGRPAWISDYAAHFNTSRHFIARGINGRPDYFSQRVKEGTAFNVFRQDKPIEFHLLIDTLRCKMGFYYRDLETNERILLKTYSVGLGRLDPSQPSGTLTPLGRYVLGEKVAIYKPGTSESMVRLYGTRWIPLEQEGGVATGYGLQGVPWTEEGERLESIGSYDSDGCIRLSAEDMEELFAIVITKPTFVEIVRDFHEAKLPGVEVAAPSR